MAASNSTFQLPPGAVPGDASLRAIRPPVVLPDPWKWVWISLAVLLLAAAAYYFWRRWQNCRLIEPAIPIIPAHVRARQMLDEALALIAQPREFCIAVSDIARSYLEDRFALHAPDRTTEEFLHELRQSSLLTPAQKDQLGEFLQQCDLVKFARYEPGEPELRDLHGSALRLVEETEPVVQLTATELNQSLDDSMPPQSTAAKPDQSS